MTREEFPGTNGRPVFVQLGDNVTIHDTARFGADVRIENDVSIGPGCKIGAHCRLTNTRLDQDVVLKPQVRLVDVQVGMATHIGQFSIVKWSQINQNVTIGSHTLVTNTHISADCTVEHGCEIEDLSPDILTVITKTHIGRSTVIKGWIKLGVGKENLPTYIGERTRVINENAGLAASVAQGAHIESDCHIIASNIGHSRIGKYTRITEASIGNNVAVGADVSIRPNVVIPDNWEIPDSVIVNAGPSGPVVIPKTYR